MLNNLLSRYPILISCKEEIIRAVDLLESIYKSGGVLYVCGNGGSAADAEHISGELLKSFLLPRELRENDKNLFKEFGKAGEMLGKHLQTSLPAVPISSLTSINTATANDNGADFAFAQIVWGLIKKSDGFLAISTSGSSKNVVNAAIAAKAKGASVITLTGAWCGELKQYTDVCISVAETENYKIQELHLPIYHYICAELEYRFFGS